MGEYRSKYISKILVWAAFVVMALAAIAMFITIGKI
jgi:hypothetical protein